MGFISVALSAQTQPRVSNPRLPADFPDEVHLRAHVLDIFGNFFSIVSQHRFFSPLCPGIVLIQHGELW